jgi:hypothetical protein
MKTLNGAAPTVAKLLRLLASDQPGEIVATARALQRVLHTAGLDLHDLANAIEPVIRRGALPGADEALAMIRCCNRHANMLSAPELTVVHSVSSWFCDPPPNKLKMEKLRAIYERCLKRERQRERDHSHRERAS